MHTKEEVGLFLLAREDGMSIREAAAFAGVTKGAGQRWAEGLLPRSYTGAPARIEVRRKPARRKAADMGIRGLYDPPETGPLSGLTPDKVENALLRAVLDDLKAGGSHPASMSTGSLCGLAGRLIAATGLSQTLILRFLGIPRSTYGYHRSRAGRDKYAGLRARVREIFEARGRACGYRPVWSDLRMEGTRVSEKVVRRIMAEEGLRPAYLKPRRRYSSYAGENGAAPPNLPLREDGTHDFSAPAPNLMWVTDITEFRLPGDARKVYLSPVIDCFDGRPVSWSIGASPSAALANSSLEAACATLAPGERPVVHSDRGWHYRHPGWVGVCERFCLVRSMSRKGRSPDNARAEGFFGLLKNEFLRCRDWAGVRAEEFMSALGRWVEWYRSGRTKRSLGWRTMDENRRALGYAV